MIIVVNVRPQVPIVRIEAPPRRRVPSHVVAQMPLAHRVRPVARGAQVLRYQALAQPEAERLLRRDDEVMHADVRLVAAAHQRRPRRRAHRRDVVAIEGDAEGGQRVDVRRGYLVGAVEADVVEALHRRVRIAR